MSPKSLRLSLLFFTLAFFSACTDPIDSDFQGEQQGLADNELIWILRFDRAYATGPENGRRSLEDSVEIALYNEPVFEQVIPRILEDLENEEIDGYDNLDAYETNKPVKNPEALLEELGGTWQDYTPLVQVAEIYAKGITLKNKEFISTPLFLNLVWVDPEHNFPNRKFVSISMKDIQQKEYQIEVRGEQYAFDEYMARKRVVAYPVYIRSNQVDYQVKSRREANFLLSEISNGSWSELEWGEEGLNLSGMKPIETSESHLRQFEGIYRFEKMRVGEDSISQLLYLTAESDFLIADWSSRLEVEKLYPFKTDRFFSYIGEEYHFDVQDSALLFITTRRDTIPGRRNRKGFR